METTEEEVTRKVDVSTLADLLDVSKSAVSRAGHMKFFCQGFPVFEWAEWHPRGNKIRFYRVPRSVMLDLVPPEEYDRWGLNQWQ